MNDESTTVASGSVFGEAWLQGDVISVRVWFELSEVVDVAEVWEVCADFVLLCLVGGADDVDANDFPGEDVRRKVEKNVGRVEDGPPQTDNYS